MYESCKEKLETKRNRLAKALRDTTGIGINTARDIARRFLAKKGDLAEIVGIALQKGWPIDSTGKLSGPKGIFDLTLLLLCLSCQKTEPLRTTDPSPPSASVEIEDSVDASVAKLEVDESRVLGTWITKYNFRNERSRAHNIELAASKVDGVDIQPGKRFSFNQRVGVRSKENGFVEAGVLFMGMHDTDIGGGTCQVASTIHASALMSGMRIVSRTPHSRFSAYIDPGLDATVVYPPECLQKCLYSADLVIENPYQLPVGIRIKILDPEPKQIRRRLQVQFVGLEPDFKPFYSYKGTPFGEPERKVVSTEKTTGPKKVQKSSPGYKLLSTVRYVTDAGVRLLEYKSEYQPVDEVWEVGDGYDGGDPWEALPDASTADGGPSETGP